MGVKVKGILRIIISVIKLILNILLFPIVLLSCIVARYCNKKIDIGIGPLPLINNVYWKKALKLKGYTVETFANAVYFITDEFDFIYDRKNHRIYHSFPVLFFIRMIFRYKVIYIYFNGGPLQVVSVYRVLEPILLKIARVKVVVMPYGSDSQIFDRTPNKLTVHSLCQDYPDFFRYKYTMIRNNVIRWSRFADIVIGTMDSVDYLHFWNRIRQCHFALDTEKIQPVYNPPQDVIRILHAPNHKEIKGTKFIERAIEELRSNGYRIEYIFKQGLPNSELIKLIQSADIVIDQLIMGWHGMFALEAMAAGKPTICYMREDLVGLYEDAECVNRGEIPLINATPGTIKPVLEDMFENKEMWNEQGRKSRAYVEKYHSLSAVGDFFDEINHSIGI